MQNIYKCDPRARARARLSSEADRGFFFLSFNLARNRARAILIPINEDFCFSSRPGDRQIARVGTHI